jgi:energy-coupling factor transport system ATP-binding protein
VAPGNLLLILGPSGSGKSTLALALAGLIPFQIPSTMTGRLELDDRDLVELGPAAVAPRVGLLLQDPASQLVMERVEDEVAFGLENRGWDLASMKRRVPEVLDAVGLAGLERRRSRRLSGGQQQRLALAGALAPAPGLLILDEPTANLDREGTTSLMASLGDLRRAGGTTIVLIEHRVDEAWPLADAVLALDGDGGVIDFGPPADVAARSAERIAAAGSWLPAAIEPSIAGTGGALESPRVGRLVAGEEVVRANDVRFSYERGNPVLRDISLTARVGERIALVGPNGSGKSTLGRLLVGLLRPDHGGVRLGGLDPARLPAAELARRAGYVFQDPERQFLAERVEDEASLGLTPDEMQRMPALLERLHLPLSRFAHRSPYRLSGGEKRRLSLACSLIRRPGVLVLDEPTFGQDRNGYRELLAIVREQVDAGTCLIAATHDDRFIGDVASRVIRIEEGWVLPGEGIAA